MALNTLRGRFSRSKGETPPASLGEPDARVFNCPRCTRPLPEGTARCSGCGQRLVMGVALKRASILIIAGFVIGTFAGAALTSGVITTIISSAASAISLPAISLPHASASPGPSAAVGASPAPTPVPSVIAPPAAVSALTQTTLLDVRIAADAANLLHASKVKAHAADIAAIIRSLATDATIGMDQASRLGAWPQAAVIAADRSAFYTKLAGTAQDALQASVTNDKAYRRSATNMLSVLKRLVDLDARSRGLAAIIGITLPPVDLSAVR
jgi:hypothetical protein